MDIDFFGIGIVTLIFWVVSKYLRIYFETEINHKKEDFYLKYAWIGAFFLFYLCNIGQENKYGNIAFNNFAFAFFSYIIYKINDKTKSRNYLIASIPVFILGNLVEIIKSFSPYLFKLYGETLSSFTDFSKFWFIGFAIYAFRQTKNDRMQRQKELEEMRILEKQKNTLEYQVNERTAEITKQKNELEKTVIELKATQNQLIQSEKMASLGELTAGIAHEIQNPLNFVNNFSEVSTDLCKEIEEELQKDNFDKKLINELFIDLSKNQEKITFHGKRAAGIVKGMLMHSRTSAGQKELTDINSLADEFLRLAYHGLRAKDKSFQANFKTDFDPNLPKIEVVPQDIGRVLLNLINNAFQAPLAPDGRTKKVVVKTFFIPTSVKAPSGGWGAITVSDNGMGMSPETQTKIFQPFFTTKPTGQGTGLGLSISFDIIKAHGGELVVHSTEGQGTEFTIKLPIKK